MEPRRAERSGWEAFFWGGGYDLIPSMSGKMMNLHDRGKDGRSMLLRQPTCSTSEQKRSRLDDTPWQKDTSLHVPLFLRAPHTREHATLPLAPFALPR